MHIAANHSYTNIFRKLINGSLIFFLFITCFAGQVHEASATSTSTFIVTWTTDEPDASPGDGVCLSSNLRCTLRAAIQEANANAGADIIQFESSVIAIPLFSPLPALSDASGGTTINGGSNLVSILGNFAGAAADGLTLNSNNNKIQALEITTFFGNAIVINGDNNFVGVDGDNINDALEGNVIRSNGMNGILVNTGADNNRIAGNRLGVDRNGTAKQNGGTGIVLGGANNRVGVLGDGISDNLEGNYISMSGQEGIFVFNSGNAIAGNTIYFNTLEGILVSLCNLTLIGTNGDGVGDAYEGNLIRYNQKNGIKLYMAAETTIAGNRIGVNDSGTAEVGNTNNGIYSVGSYASLIGTDGAGSGAAAEGNLISGNFGHGILLENSYSFTIAGNIIGADQSGTLPLGNFDGIQLVDSPSNIIGTNGDGIGDAFETNLISGNSRNGIAVLTSTSNLNTIAGNRIGVNLSGNLALPNDEYGIFIQGGRQNLVGADGIGSAFASQRNIISGNLLSGIYLKGDENRIAGNYIGLDASGSAAIPNHWGITVVDAYNNFIGTNSDSQGDANEGNWISGNLDGGILIKKSSSTSALNKIYGNKIGVNAAGAGAMPNGGPGVLIENVGNNSIGGGAANQGNVIMHNPAPGIRFTSIGEVTGNRFQGNSLQSNQFGIDLGNDLLTYNDASDGDLGPNGFQNFPVLLGAESTGDTISFVVNFNSKSSRNYYLDFYWSPVCHATGYGEGQLFLGSSVITTGATGNFIGQVAIFASGLRPGYITATATDEGSSTSEFSACVPLEGELYGIYLPVIIR